MNKNKSTMKKLFAIIFAVCTITAYSQKGILLTESFDASTVPPTGWTIDAQSGNWSASASANAGGTAAEAKLGWSPQFNGMTRLISPVVDLSGITSLAISFKHFHDTYSPGGNTLGIATTSSATGTWNDVWTVTTGAANIGPETILALVSNGDVGQADFQFCIYFDGDSYNMDNWFMDDILLYSPEQTDLALGDITVPSYFAQGSQDITGAIANMGLNDITSADINWQVDGGTTYTMNVSGLSLSIGDAHDFTHDDVYTATPGDHSLKVWVSNVNGAGDDDDPTNNELIKVLHVGSQSVTNLPLFEEFTSSTCGPCATFNANTFTPFLNSHPGEYALIKYQMDWPGSGDIYYTAEGGERRAYYGVSYVPHLFTGGMSTSSDNTGVTTNFNYEAAKPTFFTIEGTHQVNDPYISVQAEIMPYVNTQNFTVHAVVVENVTTGNVGSNGETEFHKVMMKMLPDASGTQVNFNDGTPRYLNFDSIDLSSTNIEEFSDLSPG